MPELSFDGYGSFAAGPDDPMRVKWNGVRLTLDAPSLPLAPISDLNAIVNRKIIYTAEPLGVDIWQKPMQTWTTGHGDCEDYAILKYALLKATIPVRVVVGAIMSLNAPDGRKPHAWCAAYLANEWHALDQEFDRVIPVSEYINWLPIAACHDDTVMLFGKQFTINEMIDKAKV